MPYSTANGSSGNGQPTRTMATVTNSSASAVPGPSSLIKNGNTSSSKKPGIHPTNGNTNSTLLSFNEPIMLLKFVGRNETEKVEVDGWTRKLPIEFIGLKDDLKIKTITPTTPDKGTPARFTGFMQNRVDLKDLSLKASYERNRAPYPVLVTVIAKRSIDLIVKNQQIMMYGEVLVGDETGYCRLIATNDSIHTVYEQVQIGDKLLVGGATLLEFYPGPNKLAQFCVKPDLFQNFDLRLNIYDSRNVFRLVGMGDGKLPSYYIADRQILTVHDLLSPSLSKCTALEGKPDSHHFDVIGVISYVSRIQRYRDFRGQVLINNENNHEDSTVFLTAFRWIELIDRNSRETIPLLFYVSKDNWDIQQELVPGSLLLVTNVKKHFADYHSALASSRYSKIHLNKGILPYLDLFPDSPLLQHLRMEFLEVSAAKEILGRPDIEWSAGGSYSLPLADEEAFANAYRAKKLPPPENTICTVLGTDPKKVLLPRESVRYTFLGYIIKFGVVTSRGCSGFTTNTNPEMRKECNIEIESEYNANSSLFFLPHQNWYTYKRALPKIDMNELMNQSSSRKPTTAQLYESFSAEYKKYCGPLLLPAQGDFNSLKDLPALDCFPLITIQIRNRNVEPIEQYFCVWKSSRAMPLDRMVERLNYLINCKSLCFMVDVHYTGYDPESKKKIHELVLQDVIELSEVENDLPNRPIDYD